MAEAQSETLKTHQNVLAGSVSWPHDPIGAFLPFGMVMMLMMMICCLWQRPGLIQGGNEGDSRQERGGTAAKYGHTGLFIFSPPPHQPADLTELT